MQKRSKERSKTDTTGASLRISAQLIAAFGIAVTVAMSQCSGSTSAKFNQYYVQGEKLYLAHCSNCHQKDGSGLRRVYPPINVSDYMEQNFQEVICLIRRGKTGELIVNGKQYQQPMPGIPTLSDLEVAEIATYIYNTWGRERGIVDVKEAEGILNGCRQN